jgi:hypothetical protein
MNINIYIYNQFCFLLQLLVTPVFLHMQGALMLRPPPNRPRDIPTHTIHLICLQNILSTVTIFYSDTSTMWHFSTVTFWLCDNFLLWHFDPKWMDYLSTPKMAVLSQCDILTHCNFGQPMAVTFFPFRIFIFCWVFWL